MPRPAGSGVKFTAFGESKTMAEWIVDSRCKVTTLAGVRYRLSKGMDLEQALAASPEKQEASIEVGTRKGMLVTTDTYRPGRQGREVLCRCDCGTEVWKRVLTLSITDRSSCGCGPRGPKPKYSDYPGQSKKERYKRWSARHKERRAHYLREWKKANPHRTAAYGVRRRQVDPRMAATKDVYVLAKSVSPVVCYLCGKITHNPKERQVDHRHPVSLGGTHDIGNLAIACSFCNASKNNLPEAEFLIGRHEVEAVDLHI